MASSDHSARAAAALAAALFALAALVAGARCFAATVRTKADMRLWETVADRTAPLAWPWTGAAESAEISFSNRLDGAVSSVRVARVAGETRGSCALPFPQAREQSQRFFTPYVETALCPWENHLLTKRYNRVVRE